MSNLSDRVKRTAEEAIAQGLSSCYVMTDKFECDTRTRVNMNIMLDGYDVHCHFEDVGNDKVKIWLRWKPLPHDNLTSLLNLGDALPNKEPEGGGSIRG